MWPFNRQKAPDFSEVVETMPDVPCADKLTHYYWTDIERMTCPKCVANENKRKEVDREYRLAELIASKVIEKMKGGAA